MIDFLWFILEIAVNVFQGIIITHYAYSFMGDKRNRHFIKNGGLLSAMIMATSLTIVNHLFVFDGLFFILIIGTDFVYSLISLKGTILKKLFVNCFSTICILVITSIVSNFFATLFGKTLTDIISTQDTERFISLIANQLIILYVYQITLKLFAKTNNKDDNLEPREWSLILVVLVLSVLIAFCLNTISLQHINHTGRMFVVLSVLGIAFMNIVTVFLVIDLSKKNRAIKENELLKLQQSYQKKIVDNAKSEYDVIRKMRHDFKNNFVIVENLLQNEKIEKAKEYLSNYNNKINNFELYINTNNDIVNAIINIKSTVAKGNGINVSVTSISDFDNIDDIDLSNLLSNMFDNAIESCTKLDTATDKFIKLSITSDESNYSFFMKNTITESVLKNNPLLSTSKLNKNSHGYGTRIIKDIAKKYSGICDFYEEDNYFCCRVLLSRV